MEMQKMLKRLLAGQVKMVARLEEKVDNYHKKMMARWNTHQETTTTVPDPEMMQSAEEHQEIPSEDDAIMPVVEPRQRHGVRYLAAESHRKRKDRTRGNHGSRRKSAVARMKVSRHATMAWRNMKLFRKSGTQDNCGPPKHFAAAGMRKGLGCKNGTSNELQHLTYSIQVAPQLSSRG
jgi:hypothetical protein